MLIGLNGRKRAGKDTVYSRVAHIMADVMPVERASFADLLYRSAAASLDVTVAQLQEWKSKPTYRVQVAFDDGARRWTYSDHSIREYLQRYGTEAHREVFGDDFWVEQVSLAHADRIVLVTDVRFPNEAEAVRRAGGVVVEVIGPMGRATPDTHASEAPLPDYLVDGVIYNTERNDSFVKLDTAVHELLRAYLKEAPLPGDTFNAGLGPFT